MNKIELVIFDMDGLMFDTERIAIRSCLKEGKACGYPVTEEMILETIGLNEADTCLVYKKHFGDEFPYEDFCKARTEESRRYMVENGVPLKEGLLELLDYLDEKGLKKAVATSSSRDVAEGLLKSAGVLDRFDTVICGDEITKGKPEPEIFLKACEKLGIEPVKALVLEDSEMGLLAAHAAGIKCIVVPDVKPPSQENEKKAYAKVKSLLEVKNMPL